MEILVTIPDTLTEHLQPRSRPPNSSCNDCCSKKLSQPCIVPVSLRRCNDGLAGVGAS